MIKKFYRLRGQYKYPYKSNKLYQSLILNEVADMRKPEIGVGITNSAC